MSELFFVIKAFAVTVLVIFVLQIRVGQNTIEQHSLAWMHRSSAIEALRGVADGAVAAGFNGVEWAKAAYQKKFGSDQGGTLRTNEKRSAWEKETSRPYGDEVD